MHLSPQMPKLGTYAEVAAGIVEARKLADWHGKLQTHRKIQEGFRLPLTAPDTDPMTWSRNP